MAKKQGNAGDKLKAAAWGLRLAWKIDKGMMLGWLVLSVGLAVLPAVALGYNRSVTHALSAVVATGAGQFSQVVPTIITLGVILTISGLSARLNDDLLYMMMFDSYYLGIEEEMMDAGQRIDLTELTKKETGDAYFAAISRCGSLTDLMSSGCALLSKLVTVASLLAVGLTVSKVVFVAALIYVVGVIGLNSAMSGKIRIVWSELREYLHHAEYFEKLSQNGDTAKETRIFESSDKIINDWENAYVPVKKMEMRRFAGNAKINFMTGAGFYVFMAVAVGFSVFRVGAGAMGPDVLLMVYTMCTGMAAAIGSISRSYQRMDYGLYGLDIQRRFFEGTPKADPKKEAEKADTPADDSISFEAENLCFSYRPDTPILKNLNFKIKKGESVALVGTNGCGKTTLIKILLGLYRATSGTVKMMGRPYADYKQGFISAHVGAFFQEFFLFHFTLGENVGIGDVDHTDDTERILDAMEKGGAKGLIAKLPKGLQTMLGRQVYKDGAVLSGGEGQRVAVSRAHMSGKDILVFDEPASMLDPIAEMEQFFHIKQRLRGRTAILVSHRIGFARLADRILVLSGGELAEEGTHEELMKMGGVYAAFFNEQAQWYDTEGAAASEKGGVRA